MDDIVKQAMAKWPNVPHCYGWLALDARGTWRMRDERAQAQHLPGDAIRHTALLGFINRNYVHDESGRWYFQNGPQRVYVNLEATPYVARTDPEHEFVLHTAEPLGKVEAAWLTDDGALLLKHGEKVALLDDRDMAQCLPLLHLNGKVASDEDIMRWLEQPEHGKLSLNTRGGAIPIAPIARTALASHFGFVPAPVQDPR